MFPKVVYHKSFDGMASEKERGEKSRVVKSEKHLAKLGEGWGDHPALGKAEMSEEKKLKKGKK